MNTPQGIMIFDAFDNKVVSEANKRGLNITKVAMRILDNKIEQINGGIN